MTCWQTTLVRCGLFLLVFLLHGAGTNGAEAPGRAEEIEALKSKVSELPMRNLGQGLRRRLSTRIAGEDPRAARVALEELQLLAPSQELLTFVQTLDPLLQEQIKAGDQSRADELDALTAKTIRAALAKDSENEFSSALQTLTASLRKLAGGPGTIASLARAYRDAGVVEETLRRLKRPEANSPTTRLEYLSELLKSDLRFTSCFPRSELWKAFGEALPKSKAESEKPVRRYELPWSEWEEWHEQYVQVHRVLGEARDIATFPRAASELNQLLRAAPRRSPTIDSLLGSIMTLSFGYLKLQQPDEFAVRFGSLKTQPGFGRDPFHDDFWDLRDVQDDVVVRLLPRYLGAPDPAPPLTEQTPSTYLNRLLADSVRASDWPLVERILFVAQSSLFDGAISVRNLAGVQRYAYAHTLIEQGKFEDGAAYLLLSLHSGSTMVPPREVGALFDSIRRAHPQECALAVAKAADEGLVQQLRWAHRQGGPDVPRIFLTPMLLPPKGPPEARFGLLSEGVLKVPAAPQVK